MRYCRRAISIGWFCACCAAAVNAAAQMFVTFAPLHAESLESRQVELASIERARHYWAGGVFTASAMLVISAGALVLICWKQGTASVDGNGGHSAATPQAGKAG